MMKKSNDTIRVNIIDSFEVSNAIEIIGLFQKFKWKQSYLPCNNTGTINCSSITFAKDSGTVLYIYKEGGEQYKVILEFEDKLELRVSGTQERASQNDVEKAIEIFCTGSKKDLYQWIMHPSRKHKEHMF
jgi:hypothetical protein